MHDKEPLYRKVNTRTRNVHHGGGAAYRYERNTKREKLSQASRGSMHANRRNGRDYTPLFRFLLSRVGQQWSTVHSEAVSRLDKPDPIFWLVARADDQKQSYVRIGESTYYSGLFVDDDGRLAIVDPNLRIEHMTPSCACCTHTFNGIPFTQSYIERS
ncbi:MAG: hypothetical protein R3D67_21415 [Hyphomicrobiaceae bacterium]